MDSQKFFTVLVIFICLLLININSVSINAQIMDATNPTKKTNIRGGKTPVKNSKKAAKVARDKVITVKTSTVVKYKKASSLVIATLPNVDISLISTDKKKRFNKVAKVTSEGSLIFEDLMSGKYKLAASLKGYKSKESEILISPEKTQFIAVNLELLSPNSTIQANEPVSEASSSDSAAKKTKDSITIEREAWNSIRNSANPKDFDSFLKEFPRGANAARAKIRLEQLAWESVKESQDIKKVQDYLREFPKGKNAILAKNKLQQLTKRSEPTKTPSNTNVAAKQPVSTDNKQSQKTENSKQSSKTKDNLANLPAANIDRKEPNKTEVANANNNLQKNTDTNNSTKANANLNDKTNIKNVGSNNTNQNSVPIVNTATANPLSAKEYLKECQEKFNLQKLNDALQSCTKAIELGSNEETPYVLRGNIYSAKADFDSALKDYTRAIEINPEYPLYYSNRGFAHNNKKDYPKAISDFTLAIGLNYAPASIFITRGQAYFSLNKFDEAIADFTRAIVIKPDNANIYRERARAYLARANITNKVKNRNSDLEKAQIDTKLADAVEKQNP